MGFLKRHIKSLVLSDVYPLVYRRACAAPVVPSKVVFVEVRGSSLSDNFRLVHERLREGGRHDISVHFLGESSASYPEYFRNCIAMLKDIATARYVFLDDACNVIGSIPLRDGTKVVQLWHACGAFKKWGMSTADLLFGGSRESKLKHPHYGNLSLVTISSPEVAWAYIEAMHLESTPEIVKPLGVSRTDVYFDREFLAAAREQVEAKIPAAHGKKIMLYAPTFRGRVASASAPTELDIALLMRELGGQYVLLVKQHPFVKNRPPVPDECKGFAFDVSDDFPIDVLMAASDLCISDYSSLIFEYSLLSRPMAFFAFDKAEYDDWRGFYYDYDELTPGPVFTATEEIAAWVQSVSTSFDSAEVDAFRAKFMSACDGHATDRILEEVFD